MILDPKKLEEVVNSISQALPPGLVAMQSDMEKNIKAALSAMLSKLDLVTREEFDIQANVLQRTREKLTELEKKVSELEQHHDK